MKLLSLQSQQTAPEPRPVPSTAHVDSDTKRAILRQYGDEVVDSDSDDGSDQDGDTSHAASGSERKLRRARKEANAADLIGTSSHAYKSILTSATQIPSSTPMGRLCRRSSGRKSSSIRRSTPKWFVR